MNVTVETLTIIASAILSLVFEWVPVAKIWFDTKTPAQKQSLMALAVLAVTIGAFLLSCYAPFTFLACTATSF